ncbi:DUF748 domain-containing protein [Aquimarina agarivorans]|uniref:DUF748 domain-containing protein n=1 Tax=Aquimarina agarivorans TaxID=980584 RepID=UPI000248FAE9|nr:DUF748 domain-containing protein [Aquimarina agarivorans]
MKKNLAKKKRIWIPATILIIIISLRIALPFILKSYVNKTLANIPNYYGQVADIDISLIRGAYVIKGLYLNKVDAKSQIPFLDFKQTDISIQWKSLINGEIVSEIVMNEPSFTYVFEDHKSTNNQNTQEAEVEDWSKALTNLVPIDINRLKINNGKLAFVEVTTDPTIDLQLNTISLEASNLRNIVREGDKLPSNLNASAVSIGNGTVTLNGNMDIIKSIPDIDISFSLKNADVTALNDFTKHYAGIDFSGGKFGVASEIAINDAYLKGYIKPILDDAKLIGKEDKFLNSLWEGFVGFFKFVVKNQKENTIATKVPIEGDLSNVKTKIFPTITNIFKNAWIKAYENISDESIEFKDASK